MIAVALVPSVLASVVLIAALWAFFGEADYDSDAVMMAAARVDDSEAGSRALQPGILNIERLRTDAKADDANAQYQLGIELVHAYERSGDASLQSEALQWMELAASTGHIDAQTAMGHWSRSGRAVVQDFSKAVGWYQKAANSGGVEAMYELGTLASKGRGVSLSIVDAYVWLNLAAARGEKRAQNARRDVIGRLSAEQLQEAQRLSSELDSVIPRPGIVTSAVTTEDG